MDSESCLSCRDDLVLKDTAVAAASSGLKNNTTLRKLTLEFPPGATNVYPLFTSLRDHPLLQRLFCVGKR
jgi:hypothetical protein